MCWLMIGLWVRRPTVRNANGGLMTCMRSWRYFARFKKPPRKTAIVDNLKTRYPADRMTLPFSRSMYCKFDFFFKSGLKSARVYLGMHKYLAYRLQTCFWTDLRNPGQGRNKEMSIALSITWKLCVGKKTHFFYLFQGRQRDTTIGESIIYWVIIASNLHERRRKLRKRVGGNGDKPIFSHWIPN